MVCVRCHILACQANILHAHGLVAGLTRRLRSVSKGRTVWRLLPRHSRLDACCRNISPVSNDGMGSAEQHWALCRSCQCHSRMHSASARSRQGRTDAVTKKNPKRIDARGVASMCKLETEQQGGRGMGCRPVSACRKYNSQTQIAFHQPQRALRGLSVAVSGDMNWHTEVPP